MTDDPDRIQGPQGWDLVLTRAHVDPTLADLIRGRVAEPVVIVDDPAELGEIWYLLICKACNPDYLERPMPQPFYTAAERGRWAGAHTRGTGHDQWLVIDQPRTRGPS